MKKAGKVLVIMLACVLVFTMMGCSEANNSKKPTDVGSKTTDDAEKEKREEQGIADVENENEEPEQSEETTQTTEDPSTVPEPQIEKETAYKSGTTMVYANDGYYYYELQFVDGELVSGTLDSDEGKGGWGGDSGYGIEHCEFYGMTVEEVAAQLEGENYTVTIQ